ELYARSAYRRHDYAWYYSEITRAILGFVLILLPVVAAAVPDTAAAPAEAKSPQPPAPAAPGSTGLKVAHAAVASDHPLASAAGLAALKAGGNAVDAACATALALGVLHPESSGIGGGAFMLVYVARDKKVYALDARERAPVASSPAAYLKDGRAVPELSQRGGLAVAVPGEVRGLGEMVRRWGALPFRRCVEPAQKLAARGFPVSSRLAGSLATLDRASDNRQFIEVFAAKPLHTGDIWRRPDLAWTLGKLRAGADAFYKGDVAKEIVAAVRGAGGVMTAEDLASYTTVDRTPLETGYRGLRVLSMPPASSGGVALIETLGILAARYPSGVDPVREPRGSAAQLHVLAEAFKHAFADRARTLGDTDFVAVDVAHLISPAYHAELARRIKPGAVLPRDAYGTAGPPPAPRKDAGTTHLSVIDAEGNAVALTTTVNLGFGAHLVAGKTGIVLNDEMDDFSLQPGVPNAFGLIGNEQNAIAPRKRPLSSMTPTIAIDDGGRVRVVVGAAGGPTIITSTAQVFLNVVDWKMDAQAAIAAPRIHHQWFPEVLGVEPEIGADVIAGLGKSGHKVKTFPHIGTVNLLVKTDSGIEAAAEPRSPSKPAGY
ncbi:MAG TPA: gamma-glutamyltransferase, partial [Polyangia bacterium]|nr:gamma-glutamyltransferase [Polyangia bacterium]